MDAVFIVPHYSDSPLAGKFLDWTIRGLLAQTDHDWRVVVVDDASPDPVDRERVRQRVAELGNRAVLLEMDSNRGQGVCRNLGASWAAAHGASFVLFNDADDVSHPRRLEVTHRAFSQNRDVGFVYSTFQVVDEDGRPIPRSSVTPSVAEILDSHRFPVEGRHGWIRIGTETGYTSLTSTVAVRIEIATRFPSPPRGSEDAHTWLRMSAATSMRYEASIPSQYRIPQNVSGSADRTRMGADFYRGKAALDLEGFMLAAATAVQQGDIDPASVPVLRRRFLERLAKTLRADGQNALADQMLDVAAQREPMPSPASAEYLLPRWEDGLPAVDPKSGCKG